MPTRMVRPAPYRLKVIAAQSGLVMSSSGAAMHAEPFGDPDEIDTLIVVGGWGTQDAMRDEATLAFVRETARTARRVCSVCSAAT